MVTEYKRINLLIGNAASLGSISEEGTPAIWSDTGYRLGWLADGAWKLAALRGSSETFQSITLSSLPANAVPRASTGKTLVAGSIQDTGTAVSIDAALSVTSLSNGYIPIVSTAGGLLGNSSLSEDAISVKSSKNLQSDQNVLAGKNGSPGGLFTDGDSSTWASVWWRLNGVNVFVMRYAAVSDWLEIVRRNDDGSQRDVALKISRTAGGWSKATGGFGFHDVTPPASRPTISGQRTATATLAALYQALSATGLILDSTTGSSVTREAIIQPLPITNAAPGAVTVVSGGMKSFGFDGGASTEELFYHCDVQHDYIAGGDMVFHVHWMPATATGGNVKWQIEYQWVEDGATWPAPTTLTGTTAAGTTAWSDKRTDFTIPGVGKTYNSRLMVRLFRNPADAADTYAGDAVLSSVGMHYQADPGQP